ncbi:MAG: MobQ family relaxase [Rikenellaceae bacterium]
MAAAAYRSGEKLHNLYDGETHDYTHKGGVAHTAILLPDHAPRDYLDRSTLWNEVETVERSKNAQLAREVEVGIPKEIPREQWVPLMEAYCKQNFVSRGMIADLAIHDKDPNNPHCHILLTMRPMEQDGTWGAKSRKEYITDTTGQRIPLPSGTWKSRKVDTTDWNSRDNAEEWRASWGLLCNQCLAQNHSTQHIDHRSYERQGIDQLPTVHMGVASCQMERKGIPTQRGEINRQVIADNKQIRATRARITRLMKWQRDEKSKPLDLSHTTEKVSVLSTLSTLKDTTASTHYQKLKHLKQSAQMLSFMQSNHIDSLEDFYEKIAEMNKGFYALQKEIKATQTAIANLNPKSPSYKKDRKKLEGEIALCQWKLTAFKDELGRAERVKKALEELAVKASPTQERGRVEER